MVAIMISLCNVLLLLSQSFVAVKGSNLMHHFAGSEEKMTKPVRARRLDISTTLVPGSTITHVSSTMPPTSPTMSPSMTPTGFCPVEEYTGYPERTLKGLPGRTLKKKKVKKSKTPKASKAPKSKKAKKTKGPKSKKSKKSKCKKSKKGKKSKKSDKSKGGKGGNGGKGKSECTEAPTSSPTFEEPLQGIYDIVILGTGTYICGDEPDGSLSLHQRLLFETALANYLFSGDNLIAPGLTPLAIQFLSFTQHDCCLEANPFEACEEQLIEDRRLQRGRRTQFKCRVPTQCAVSCSDSLILPPSSAARNLQVSTNEIELPILLLTSLQASFPTLVEAVVTDQAVTIIEEDTCSGSACFEDTLCCGIAPGCMCEDQVSESFCSNLGCEIDPEKSCCMYDFCTGVTTPSNFQVPGLL